jgi:hypothetical protein
MRALRTNAWAGVALVGEVDLAAARRFTLTPDALPPPDEGLLSAAPGGSWRDPDVGWGVVLPPTGQLTGAAAELVRARGLDAGWDVPLFHVDARRPLNHLVRDGAPVPVGSGQGVGPGRVPAYLLLLGGPAEISWEIQAWLSGWPVAVGRIDPSMPGAEHYFGALAREWDDADVTAAEAVAWSVVGDDMGQIMRDTIAAPLVAAGPPGTSWAHLDDGASSGAASAAALEEALLAQRPGLVVTTSHGRVAAHDPGLAASLGIPVDTAGQDLAPEALAVASPGGAIWVLHACCSGGVPADSAYSPLLPDDSSLRAQLDAVAERGPLAAPLPASLLGAVAPARAVIAQIELTFDWMLRDPVTGVATTGQLLDGLGRLLGGAPVGDAIFHHVAGAAAHRDAYDARRADYLAHRGSPVWEMLAHLLVARNRRATMILGDPTAALPR